MDPPAKGLSMKLLPLLLEAPSILATATTRLGPHADVLGPKYYNMHCWDLIPVPSGTWPYQIHLLRLSSGCVLNLDLFGFYSGHLL